MEQWIDRPASYTHAYTHTHTHIQSFTLHCIVPFERGNLLAFSTICRAAELNEYVERKKGHGEVERESVCVMDGMA